MYPQCQYASQMPGPAYYHPRAYQPQQYVQVDTQSQFLACRMGQLKMLPDTMNTRQRLRPWLVNQIDSGNYRGLEWLSEDKTEFKIPWKHAGKQDYDKEEDSKIFKAWSLHTGKYREGIDDPDPAMWKTRLRTALNKLPDIQEMQEKTQLDIPEPYRVYRLLPRKPSAREIHCREQRESVTPKIKKEYPVIPGINHPPYTQSRQGFDTGSFNLVISPPPTTDAFTMPTTAMLDDLDNIIQSDLEAAQDSPPHSMTSYPNAFRSWTSTSDSSSHTYSDNWNNVSPTSTTATFGSPTRNAFKRQFSDDNCDYSPKRIKIECQFSPSSSSDGSSDSEDRLTIDSPLSPSRLPPEHYLQVKINYRSSTATEYRVTCLRGFQLCRELDVRHQSHAMDGFEKIPFPTCSRWCANDKQNHLTSVLLSHIEGGVQVETLDGDVYATRLCRTVFFWNTTSATHEPQKLPRNERVKIFDSKQFELELEHHLQNGTPKPSPPHIFFGVGQRWNLECPLRNNLISVTVTPLRALEQRRLYERSRKPSFSAREDIELPSGSPPQTPPLTPTSEFNHMAMAVRAMQACSS